MSPSPLATLSDWIADRRNTLVRSPEFQRLALKLPVSRWIARRKTRQLFNIATGFVQSQVLFACMRMGLLEFLDSGPKSISEVSGRLDVPTHSAQQLLTAAIALDLVRETTRREYALGELGSAALANSGVDALVLHHAHLYQDLADPEAVLRHGLGTRSSEFWPYARSVDSSSLDSAAVSPYSALMARSQELISADVLDSVSLIGRRRLLDLGGGEGVFARAALDRWPALHATVFDLPAVAETARENLVQAGLKNRSEAIGGDLLSGSLPRGFDVVSLVRVLHDHDDDVVIGLLRRAAAALVPGGQLLIAEPMAGRNADGSSVACYFSMYLLAMGSGRPRTVKRIRQLLEIAGLSDIKARRSPRPLIVRVMTARVAGW